MSRPLRFEFTGAALMLGLIKHFTMRADASKF
jgi:hypothetical protein